MREFRNRLLNESETHNRRQNLRFLTTGPPQIIDLPQHTGSHLHGEFLAKGSRVLELLWELVRRSEFSDLPSRFTSFFAFTNLADAKRFATGAPMEQRMIYKIEADHFEQFDFNLLRQGTCLALQWNIARTYWSRGKSDDPLCECLVEHPVRILDVC